MHSSKQTGVEKGSTKERKSMIFQDWRRAGGGAGRGGGGRQEEKVFFRWVEVSWDDPENIGVRKLTYAQSLAWAAFPLISLHFLVVFSSWELGSFLPLKGIWHRIVLPCTWANGIGLLKLPAISSWSLFVHFLSSSPMGVCAWESLPAWAPPSPTSSIALLLRI